MTIGLGPQSILLERISMLKLILTHENRLKIQILDEIWGQILLLDEPPLPPGIFRVFSGVKIHFLTLEILGKVAIHMTRAFKS